ncbi:MAG: four helix bundle protein [Saprospiraceae bacterium]
MHNFKQLSVWQKSIVLAKETYQLTQKFPQSELYGLTSQIRKSVVSISSNIAEGSGRKTNKDFINFLHYAYGSSCELETQFIIAGELNYASDDIIHRLNKEIVNIQKMLFKLIEKYELMHS